MVLKNVIETCNEANVPITVCGEMAGKPRAFVLLLGMGLRRFSMSPAFVPSIKQLASQTSLVEAELIVASVMKFKTTAQVKKFMTRKIEQIAPNLKMLASD
jgi:phosphotransferase system enzyme I (PtsI)